MKRDMDLVRNLLLTIESDPRFDGTKWVPYTELPVEGHTTEEVAYHLIMMIDAGFLRGNTMVARQIVINKLTMKGHDLLDAIRDPAIWRTTKEGADRAGGFTLDLLADLAKGLIRTQIRKHTGVEI